MPSKKHIWRNRYRAPIPYGTTITTAKPGQAVVNCLREIQDVVTDLKQADQPYFRLSRRVNYPGRGHVIKLSRPGMLYSDVISELQYYVDTLLPTPHKWVYRVGIPVPQGKIHINRPGRNLANAITELQNIIDTIQTTASLLDVYNEHRQVIGQDAVESATNQQMQGWMEAYCTSFIDHVSGPLSEDSTDFLVFTPETWRAAASITGDWSGFRDMEKGFNALKWTTWDVGASLSSFKHPFDSGIYGSKEADSDGWDTWEDALDSQSDEWNAATWNDESDGGYYLAFVGAAYSWRYLYDPPDRLYILRGYRESNAGFESAGGGTYRVRFLLLSTTPTYTADIYLKFDPDDLSVGYSFHDFDSLGLVSGKYVKFGACSVAKDGATSDYIGGTNNPCSYQAFETKGGWTARVKALHKWNFTQA